MLRPGAERQSDKRARTASLEIARARVDYLKRELLLQLEDEFDPERIVVQKPRLEQTREEGDGGVVLSLQLRPSK